MSLSHKSSFGKLKKKKVKLYQAFFSGQNTIKLDINIGRQLKKINKSTWRLNNTFLNNQEVPE